MRLKAWLLVASLALGATTVGRSSFAQSPPSAENRARARENFQAGVAAYTQANYSAALDSFQTAYRLAPHPTVRINIANCYMQLHQPVEALTHFEQFLSESATVPPPQRREIEHQIETLRGQIAEVRVSVGPDGVRDAIVSVDGHATAIQNVVRMVPGHHVIEASAEGFQPARSEIDATAGLRTALTVRLQPPAPAAQPAAQTAATTASTNTTATSADTGSTSPAPATSGPSAPVEPVPARTSSENAAATTSTNNGGLPPPVFIAGVVVTVVGVALWGAFGLLAINSNSQFESAVSMIASGSDPDTQRAIGHGAAQDARTFALASDLCLAITAVAAVATVVIFTRTNFHHADVTVSPIVGTNGGGLAIVGRF